MADLDIDKRRQFYIKYNKKVMTNSKLLGLKLLRDYSDPKTVKRILDFCRDLPDQKDRPFIYCECDIPFIDALGSMLDKLGDEAIADFFIEAFSNSLVTYDDTLDIGDSISRVTIDGDTASFEISLPNSNKETNLFYAANTHELTHYPFGPFERKIESLEFSEVLAMYFEYLMYKETSLDGYPFFMNNRLIMLDSNCEDLEVDAKYAANPDILGIDPKYYHGSLASGNEYLESLEYVLNLIAREGDQELVIKSISRVIKGDSDLSREAKKLDIDTKDYKQLRKIIKN